ncbi:MAG: hypothetical protein BGN96_07275 [Bacteroidales bacterium 45-6]|nr:MAG: hypothetical protein BGN96_07275 [Bacteroidales bacterium 45-6]
MPDLEPAVLLYEGYESIRLVDYEGLSQEEASKQMGVSRPTLTRIHDKAIKSIAQAFVEGKAILIEGGDYHSDNYWYRCEDCKKLNVSPTESRQCSYCNSKNMKRLNGADSESESDIGNGICICVHCGLEIPHRKKQPCRETNCPACGKKMMRKGSYHHQLYIKKQEENENCSINKRNAD